MSFLSQPIQILTLAPTRSIGDIKGYVTVSESTVDAMEITQQPIQQGANISDHAFLKPVTLSIQILFADNPTLSLAEIYQKLLALQQPTTPASVAAAGPVTQSGQGATASGGIPELLPFTVVTPKRTYTSMLLASLGQTTDKKTENCLSITATFQQVIIVPVTTTNVPRSQLKKPGSNGGTQKVGTKSLLKKVAG